MRAERTASWFSVADAVAYVLHAVGPLPAEDVALDASDGRVLAEDVTSPIDHPPWDNSAMDGYAVRAEDVRGASRTSPVELRVTEEVGAGDFATRPVAAGEAIRIMTGAPLPEGADGVVRVEHTEAAADGRVRILDDSDAGRNVRPRGEDVQKDERVLRAGRRLRAGEIGVLASIGRATVRVHRAAHVALLATGDELVGIDHFDEVLAGKRIVNSNSHALASAVRATNGIAVDLGIARDDAHHVRTRVEAALDSADVLVTTAGASVGDHDVVKDALETLGLDVAFWRVTMRPGSPVSFGTLPRSAGRAPLPVFGLPGNPVSALVTFEVLVRPALRRMHGRTDIFTRTVRVRAAHRMRSTPSLTHYLRVTLAPGDDGMALATLTGAQGSGMLTSVARADALLVVPLGQDVLEAGEETVALLLSSPDDGQTRVGYAPGARVAHD